MSRSILTLLALHAGMVLLLPMALLASDSLRFTSTLRLNIEGMGEQRGIELPLCEVEGVSRFPLYPLVRGGLLALDWDGRSRRFRLSGPGGVVEFGFEVPFGRTGARLLHMQAAPLVAESYLLLPQDVLADLLGELLPARIERGSPAAWRVTVLSRSGMAGVARKHRFRVVLDAVDGRSGEREAQLLCEAVRQAANATAEGLVVLNTRSTSPDERAAAANTLGAAAYLEVQVYRRPVPQPHLSSMVLTREAPSALPAPLSGPSWSQRQQLHATASRKWCEQLSQSLEGVRWPVGENCIERPLAHLRGLDMPAVTLVLVLPDNDRTDLPALREELAAALSSAILRLPFLLEPTPTAGGGAPR